VFIDNGSNLNQAHRFDAVVIDSVNEMNLSPNDICSLQEKSPKTSTIKIFKATKEGRFLGQNDYSHMVQAVFKCEDGFCQSEKNRFGGE
jgi:predicted ATP-dependent serine protease